MMNKEYSPMEVDSFLKNDDLSILLKLQDNFFDIAKAKNYIQRFPHHTVSIFAFCEPDIQKNPMVIQAALPGLAKARRMDMLPENIRNNKQIMVRAVLASAEAYFALPDNLKEDLDFHLELSEKVQNFLELPISPKILANAKFLYNCIQGTQPTFVKNQILNSEIPLPIKNELLAQTRHYLYDKNISLEFVKEQVLRALEKIIMEQAAMEHNLSAVDLSYKFKPAFKPMPTVEGSVFSPFSENASNLNIRKKQDKMITE